MRILASIFGAVLLGVLVPLLYPLLASTPDSFVGYVWLAGIGVVLGAILGARFPRVFGIVFEIFMDV